MCLFTSTSDNVDIYWLNEVILVSPKGPDTPPEKEAIISGLVRASQKKCTLTFVQRGEIYDLKDKSPEWQNATKEPITDWLTKKILNHPDLGRYPRIEPTGHKGKLLTRFQSGFFPDQASVADLSNGISEAKIFCTDKTFTHHMDDMPNEPKLDDCNPIFSTFSLTFQEPLMQLFRISFRAKFGLHKYHSQIAVDVDGPDLVIDKIRRDILVRVTDSTRKADLRRRIDDLCTTPKEPRYEIAIISHPSMALTLDYTANTKKPLNFELDSEEIPMPSSAASLIRGIFLDTIGRNFTISAVATIRELPEEYSPDFLQLLKDLREESQ